VHNVKVGSNNTVSMTPPIPYSEALHKIRPGQKFAGQFCEDGLVIPNEECFHRVKNLFLVEDLAALFKKAGFFIYMTFYTDSLGITLAEDQEPKAGSAHKACLMLVKPGTV
jgi:hypothetical protein